MTLATALPAGAPAPAVPAISARTRILLEAPLLGLMLRLAAPNLAVMFAQASTGLIETFFVARLGTDALAGMAVVFPGLMLMQMMSGGAMGGGISSAVARALGAGRRHEADALVLHALVICVGIGAVFTVGLLLGGPALYRLLGAGSGALHAALIYSNIVFGGAILQWLFNGLASIIRGTGNMLVPAAVICGGAVVLIPLSPCLIFGLGPFPALGIAGGGIALITYYGVGGIVLGLYLLSRHSVVRPRLVRLRRAPFIDILRVGGVAVLVTLQTYLTISFATSVVGRFGDAAIAGFGTGNRLEYLLIPLTFGLGGPMVAIVGTCHGAGRHDRARRATWLGAILATLLTELIGLCAATFPDAWLTLFSHDPATLQAGTTYLHIVGPFYGLFGLGMALYFAAQGAGRLLWPLIAGLLRLTVAVTGGLLAWHLNAGLPGVFLALGLGLATYGLLNTAPLLTSTRR